MSSKPLTYGDMAKAGAPLSAVFDAVMRLHVALKEAPVKDRVWRHEWTYAGGKWALSLNGVMGKCMDGIPPVTCRIDAGDWPVAIVDPFGGSIIGSDEDAIIESLEAAIRAAGGQERAS